jgi:membrane protease YdiL (CAAX protease family)
VKRIVSILKVVPPAVIFLLPIVFSWNVFVALEHRFSPRVPWLALLDLVFIAVIWSAVARRWARRPVFGREPPSALTIGVAAIGLLASASLSILLATASGFGAALMEQARASQGITTTRLAFWALAHAAIVEELVLRGILQPVLEEACGLVGALVVTSVVFVLMHVGNDEFAVQWPFYILLSTVTGYVAWRSNSVALPIATHGLLNWSVNGVLALHGPVPSTVLLSYKMALLATTLLMSMLLAAFVVLDRRRFLAESLSK